ncbi:hypothetical protein CLV35_2359 [Motilibacter peucedani]|uniref:Integral membrane protein n=1 Tax=Motilibacter peucedani TaxID=598650 RepID=A0A420XNW2_9ACTN|nr:hypothetical protein [Motilibacter peucedani]RKS73865.1 hypothetical protein CLV35_2359 [Motilibacter peucedani]
MGAHLEPAEATGLPRQVSAAYAQEVDRTRRSLLAAWVTFSATFGLLRLLNFAIHEHVGPFGDVAVGGAHLHHYVWGIGVLMGVELVSLIVDTPHYNTWLGAAYGVGCALVIDEYALLLNLSDVYWSRQGRVSVDVALGVIGVLGTYLTAVHFWNHIVRLVLGALRSRARTTRPTRPRRPPEG